MKELVLCHACGTHINGAKLLVYKHIREQRTKEYLRTEKILPSSASASAQFAVEMGDVLKNLNIKRTCCASHIISALRFDSISY